MAAQLTTKQMISPSHSVNGRPCALSQSGTLIRGFFPFPDFVMRQTPKEVQCQELLRNYFAVTFQFCIPE